MAGIGGPEGGQRSLIDGLGGCGSFPCAAEAEHGSAAGKRWEELGADGAAPAAGERLYGAGTSSPSCDP